MALIVETGSIVPGAQSYASVQDADTYHEQFGNSTWAGSAEVKEAALRRATRFIDSFYRYGFQGTKMQPTQPLEWPRFNVRDPSSGWFLDPSPLPVALVQATCEAALRELVSPGALQPDLERGGAVQSKSVAAGPVSTTTVYATGASGRTVYTVLDEMLSALLTGMGSSRLVRG